MAEAPDGAERSVILYPLPRHLRLRHPPSLRSGETGADGGQIVSYTFCYRTHLFVITSPAPPGLVIQLDGHDATRLVMTALGVHCLLHPSPRAWLGVSP